MGRYVVKLPDIGEGTTEAEIVAWHVAPGQVIREEDPLVDVMTDKATVELPSPRAGTISKINYKDGEICPVGKVLVEIEEDGKVAASTPVPTSTNGNGGDVTHQRTRALSSTHQAMHSAVAANVPSAGISTSTISTGKSGTIQVVDASPHRDRVPRTDFGLDDLEPAPLADHRRLQRRLQMRNQRGQDLGLQPIRPDRFSSGECRPQHALGAQ
jgi:pyruvate/2-oxoglutarate dehydrogenase complex dihydrolipoamide acyltransferase (E2) component